MKKYEATDSKGRLHKRGTKNRTYRYVVVGYAQDHWPTYNGPTEASWASTYELAVARKKSFVSRGWKDVEILAAEEV